MTAVADLTVNPGQVLDLVHSFYRMDGKDIDVALRKLELVARIK